jgi:hypothetical protein
MAIIINMKSGDTAPLPQVTLIGADGTPQVLTGCTVKMNVSKGVTTVVDHGTVIIDNASLGLVHYDDWATVGASIYNALSGDYNLEFEVTFSNGQTRTFPNDSYITLRVTQQVA